MLAHWPRRRGPPGDCRGRRAGEALLHALPGARPQAPPFGGAGKDFLLPLRRGCCRLREGRGRREREISLRDRVLPDGGIRQPAREDRLHPERPEHSEDRRHPRERLLARRGAGHGQRGGRLRADIAQLHPGRGRPPGLDEARVRRRGVRVGSPEGEGRSRRRRFPAGPL